MRCQKTRRGIVDEGTENRKKLFLFSCHPESASLGNLHRSLDGREEFVHYCSVPEFSVRYAKIGNDGRNSRNK